LFQQNLKFRLAAKPKNDYIYEAVLKLEVLEQALMIIGITREIPYGIHTDGR
jgi:hypothetical protein